MFRNTKILKCWRAAAINSYWYVVVETNSGFHPIFKVHFTEAAGLLLGRGDAIRTLGPVVLEFCITSLINIREIPKALN